MKTNNFLFDSLGSDPEFFLKDESDQFVSGHYITEGKKDSPEPLEREGFNLFTDNLAVEGNIPPARSYEEFEQNMLYLIDQIRTRAEKYDLSIVHAGQARFNDEYCRSIQGQEFACSSALYAWQGTYYKSFDSVSIHPNKTPSFADTDMRSAGFHIHIGYHVDERTYEDYMVYDIILVKLFDLFVTLPALKIQQSEKFREENFGILSNFRSKPYGVECRSLSSYFSHPIYYEWIWNQLMEMFDYANSLSSDQLDELLNLHIFDVPRKEKVKKQLERFSPKTKNLIKEFSSLINKYEYAL